MKNLEGLMKDLNSISPVNKPSSSANNQQNSSFNCWLFKRKPMQFFPCKWRWNYVQNVILFTWRKSPNFILNFPKISLYWMHNSTKFDKKKRWKIFVRRQTLPLLFFDVLVFFMPKCFVKLKWLYYLEEKWLQKMA